MQMQQSETGKGGYTQPMNTEVGWEPPPQELLNYPPGMEYVTMLDQLSVQLKVDFPEVITGFEKANRYAIKNNLGQKFYFAAEDAGCCTRCCLGPNRAFDMTIMDYNGREVLHLNRPFNCHTCWCPWYCQELEVTAPPGTVIGYVKQDCSLCTSQFRVQNAAGDTVLQIQGCGGVEFKVKSRDGETEVGSIKMLWPGYKNKKAFRNADVHFGITFPVDLDVNTKAVLIGALFLIDFMFFEKFNPEYQEKECQETCSCLRDCAGLLSIFS